jgi:hypothetical protein
VTFISVETYSLSVRIFATSGQSAFFALIVGTIVHGYARKRRRRFDSGKRAPILNPFDELRFQRRLHIARDVAMVFALVTFLFGLVTLILGKVGLI